MFEGDGIASSPYNATMSSLLQRVADNARADAIFDCRAMLFPMMSSLAFSVHDGFSFTMYSKI